MDDNDASPLLPIADDDVRDEARAARKQKVRNTTKPWCLVTRRAVRQRL